MYSSSVENASSEVYVISKSITNMRPTCIVFTAVFLFALFVETSVAEEPMEDFIELIETIFSKQPGSYSNRETARLLDKAKETSNSLGPVQRILAHHMIQEARLILDVANHNNCSILSGRELKIALEKYGVGYTRVSPLLESKKDYIKKTCWTLLQKTLNISLMDASSSKKWQKLRAFITKKLGSESEYLLMHGARDSQIVFEIYGQFLASIGHLEKDSHLSWIAHETVFMEALETTYEKACGSSRYFELNEIIRSLRYISDVESSLTKDLNAEQLTRLERGLVCYEMMRKDSLVVYDLYMSHKYSIYAIYNLIFAPTARPLEPSETDVLLRILMSYPLTGEEADIMKLRSWKKGAEMLKIPTIFPICSRTEFERLGNQSNVVDTPNIKLYYKEFIPFYIRACASKFRPISAEESGLFKDFADLFKELEADKVNSLRLLRENRRDGHLSIPNHSVSTSNSATRGRFRSLSISE